MNHQSSRSHTLFRLHVESMACGQGMGGDTNDNVITESVLVSYIQFNSIVVELCRSSR